MSNIYLLKQTVNNGYDTYDSAVVCANSKDEARLIHPGGNDDIGVNNNGEFYSKRYKYASDDWVPIVNVTVIYIGIAGEEVITGQVICSSFNAG